MKAPIPIVTAPLFPLLHQQLVALLRTLSPADWERRTLAGAWTVKDVAAHLLDGYIRGLSMARDGYFGESPGAISTYGNLVAYLNGLNADWVKALRRVSPEVLVEWLDATGNQYGAYLRQLPPFEKAIFSVAWAGEEQSENWFHLAREYTEQWHHQQQIRFAVGQEGPLYSRELYHPYLATSMRALPHHYREVPAASGTLLSVEISGEGGGTWWLEAGDKGWALTENPSGKPSCSITIPGDIAWRIFTKGIDRAEAVSLSEIAGNEALGMRFFCMLAVMA